MSQRVNIQYTVDIQELANETQRLLARAFLKLDRLSENAASTETKDILTIETAEDIEALRIGLSDIDHCLNDVAAIIGGYLSYRASQILPVQPPAPAPELTDEEIEAMISTPQGPAIESLEEAVRKFRHEDANPA